MEKNFLGKALKRAREKKGLTQKQIAKAINVTEQSYQRYEYGTVIPSAYKIIEIATELNVSLDYLTGRTDDDSPFRKENNE